MFPSENFTTTATGLSWYRDIANDDESLDIPETWDAIRSGTLDDDDVDTTASSTWTTAPTDSFPTDDSGGIFVNALEQGKHGRHGGQRVGQKQSKRVSSQSQQHQQHHRQSFASGREGGDDEDNIFERRRSVTHGRPTIAGGDDEYDADEDWEMGMRHN